MTTQEGHFDSYEAAHAEIQRRKAMSEFEGYLHRIEKSPYEGYRIWSMDAEVYADFVSDGLPVLQPIRKSSGYPA